jgi:hypothetical protein
LRASRKPISMPIALFSSYSIGFERAAKAAFASLADCRMSRLGRPPLLRYHGRIPPRARPECPGLRHCKPCAPCAQSKAAELARSAPKAAGPLAPPADYGENHAVQAGADDFRCAHRPYLSEINSTTNGA